MFYIFLYNDRKGLNPKLDDKEFAGPILGPISSLSWHRGFLLLHWADKIYNLDLSEATDHVRYAGELYNSFKMLTLDDLKDDGYFFCGKLIAIHDVSIFSKLLNI